MAPTSETKTRIVEMRSMTVNFTTDAPFDVKTFDQQVLWMNEMKSEKPFAAFAQFCIMDDVMYLLPAEFSFQDVDLDKFPEEFPTAPWKQLQAVGVLEMVGRKDEVRRDILVAKNMPEVKQASSTYLNGRFKQLIAANSALGKGMFIINF